MSNVQKPELLQQLIDFSIDDPESSRSVELSFGARLARENGWDRVYAERVIIEYKRFLYLAVTSPQAVTPSDQVDQVWHLHLSYSRSYWDRLCDGILHTRLHHDPTSGGSEENQKYHNQYQYTLKLYRHTFDQEPPSDIWPEASIRFGQDTQAARVVPSEYWTVSKGPWKSFFLGYVLLNALLIPWSLGLTWGPFDLVRADFLYFLIPAMILAVLFGLWRRKQYTAPDWDPAFAMQPANWQQVAYMTGGKHRLLSASLVDLYQRGLLELSSNKQLLTRKGSWNNPNPVEAAIGKSLPLMNTDPNAIKALADDVEGAFAPQIYNLQQQQLCLTESQGYRAAWATAMPLLLVLMVFGFPRLIAGWISDKPVGYLIFSLIVGMILFVILCVVTPRLTRLGKGLTQHWRNTQTRLKSQILWNTPDDAALAVALFGVIVLDRSALASLKEWFPHSSDGTTVGSGGCGTGCGAGGGGGGCGGGGCGGCGGGD